MSSSPMRSKLGMPTRLRVRVAKALRSMWNGREIENHMLRVCIGKLDRDQRRKVNPDRAPARLKSVAH